MKLFCKNLIFVLIGIVPAYTIIDWQWWVWTISLITAVQLHVLAVQE